MLPEPQPQQAFGGAGSKKTEEGRDALAGLQKDADVLVHNMCMFDAACLGLDYDDLAKRFPRLVYCVAPGFGGDGRNADMPAYDDVIQAVSGLASLNTNDAGEPRFLSTIVCDKVGGLHLALAVLAGAMHQRTTGKGCLIEAPMFESMVSFQLAGGPSARHSVGSVTSACCRPIAGPIRRRTASSACCLTMPDIRHDF